MHTLNGHTLNFSATTSSAGSHTHTGTPYQFYGCAGSSATTDSRGWAETGVSTGSAGSHTHTVSGTTGSNSDNTSAASTSYSGYAGSIGNATGANLQPYITRYMWKRTGVI